MMRLNHCFSSLFAEALAEITHLVAPGAHSTWYFLMTSSAGMPGMLNFLTKSGVVFIMYDNIYIYRLYIFIYDVVPTENLTKKRDSSLKLTLTLNFEDDREQFLESTTNILPPESFLEP